MFINTPLLARIMLIFITLIIRLLLSTISSKWISFILMLLFLGGIIVLFVYICTLITKMKVLLNNSIKIFLFLSFLRLVIFFKKVEFSIIFSKVFFSLMYQKSMCILLSYSIIYLLLILYICVKIVQKHKGGLKSKFND